MQYKQGPLGTSKVVEAAREAKRREWGEALSPEGHVYYFHVGSGETTWEAPVTGYLSMVRRNGRAYCEES